MLSRKFWRNLTIIFGGVTGVLAGAALSPALPGMAEHFKDMPNGDFLVRLALTLPALFIAISAPFIGGILDRVGRKPILIVSLIIYGLAGVSGYFAPSLNVILLGRIFLGISVAGLMTGFTALIADYYEGSERDKYMGFQGAALGIGGVFLLLLAGYLADLGWRQPFLMYLLAFALLPGLLFAVNEPDLGKGSKSQATSSKVAPFPLKSLLPIYGLAVLTIISFFIFSIQLPFLLTEEFGVSNSQVGFALALQTLSSVFAALLFRRLRERASFAGILALIFVALGFNHLLTIIGGSYSLVLIGLLIGGIGLGLTPPNFNVWTSSLVPANMRGRALAGFTSALFFGQFLTPLVVQAVSQSYGPKAIFTFGLSLSGISAVLLIWWSQRERAAQKTQ